MEPSWSCAAPSGASGGSGWSGRTAAIGGSWCAGRRRPAAGCSRSSSATMPSGGSWCCPSGGSWTSPKHTTPETTYSTYAGPWPIIGLAGLLSMVQVTEKLQAAHATAAEEGGGSWMSSRPAPVPPDRRGGGGAQSLGPNPADQSAASGVGAQPVAGTATEHTPSPQAGGER